MCLCVIHALGLPAQPAGWGNAPRERSCFGSQRLHLPSALTNATLVATMCSYKNGEYMTFEWDPDKERLNLRKHKVRFDYAARVFFDQNRLDVVDDRENYGEERRITIGRIDERLFVVVYTDRGENIRLISARKADASDEEDYVRHLHP